MIAEKIRLAEARGGTPWKKWGPYLSERQWGTVREDYSPGGDAWNYLPHDHARSRAYRWGEDGIGGFSDDKQRLCFALALWNGRDPILKERLFGLTGTQGNHGEDVKECYYYLDATPTHSYLKMLYKYPQCEFPYALIEQENGRRSRHVPEFELWDTGAFDDNRYFDVFVEYAKAGAEEFVMRITAVNRGRESARLHLLPHVWFRNEWAWNPKAARPSLTARFAQTIQAEHPEFGDYDIEFNGSPNLLFCDNETNCARLYGAKSASLFPKDGINDFIVSGQKNSVNPERTGTKAAAHYFFDLASGETSEVCLHVKPRGTEVSREAASETIARRIREADEFHADIQTGMTNADEMLVQRQALAGMIWSKQFYYYDVTNWLCGDPGQPQPPASRLHQRNSDWMHVSGEDIFSMPDKWEYPWFAAWDIAFHCIPLALVDADFAKRQLLLLTHEWYMHPNGQLPAYEWHFNDVNPPVHAWATWRVYKMDKAATGKGDLAFLERVYHKLLLNFTWWVNRKDIEGNNIFQGGFLGLDNIGVFDRSATLPTGGSLEQCDGTSWMAMYCLNMMRIALELSVTNPAYQDMATKFFEHFLRVAAALTNIGGQGVNLWDESDEFFTTYCTLPIID